jgi:uncharacterized membrane protein YeaQ/YmgE (transglycosylase-associated protein family)
MGVILFLAVGLVAGVVVRRMAPWKASDGMGRSMAVGVMGAFAGAFVGPLFGYHEGDPAVFVTSALGAMVAVALYQRLSGPRTAT